MHELWYDYAKLEYEEKAKLCFIDIDSLIATLKQKTFTQILQKMLKQDFILQVVNQKAYFPGENISKLLD